MWAASALTIGSVDDPTGALSWFSSQGPLVRSGALKPDLAGPGNDVTAALMLGDVDSMAFADLVVEHGRRIPEDFALVAYDDEFSAFAAVPLTAVAPPKHDLGYAALRLCFDRIRQQDGGGHAVTRMSRLPTLVERESTRAS